MAKSKKTEQAEKEVSTATTPATPDKLTLSNPVELTVNPSEPTVVKEGKFTIIHH